MFTILSKVPEYLTVNCNTSIHLPSHLSLPNICDIYRGIQPLSPSSHQTFAILINCRVNNQSIYQCVCVVISCVCSRTIIV